MDISCISAFATDKVGNVNPKTNQTDVTETKKFNGVLRDKQINSIKQEIKDKFHVNVGEANGRKKYTQC